VQVVSDQVLDLAVVVDQAATPTDFDDAILLFLERFVERQLSQRIPATPAETPAAAEVVSITFPGDERQNP
jgi:hypothetical protein